MQEIFSEEKKYDVLQNYEATASIKVFRADHYTIVDVRLFCGKKDIDKSGRLENFKDRSDVIAVREYWTDAERIRYAVNKADEWFAVSENYLSEFCIQ